MFFPLFAHPKSAPFLSEKASAGKAHAKNPGHLAKADSLTQPGSDKAVTNQHSSSYGAYQPEGELVEKLPEKSCIIPFMLVCPLFLQHKGVCYNTGRRGSITVFAQLPSTPDSRGIEKEVSYTYLSMLFTASWMFGEGCTPP